MAIQDPPLPSRASPWASPRARTCIVAEEWRFWHGATESSHVGHAGIDEGVPFLMQDGAEGAQPELKRRPMCIHWLCPTEGLTWDDVCQLWDNGAFTAEDIRNIAPLYFEGAELSAVLEVV